MGFGGLELRARCAGFSVTEIGNRKERMRVREAGASAAGRGQRPYASFPDVIPKQVCAKKHGFIRRYKASFAKSGIASLPDLRFDVLRIWGTLGLPP